MNLNYISSRCLKLITIAFLISQVIPFSAIAQSASNSMDAPSSMPQKNPKALVEEVFKILEQDFLIEKRNQPDWNALRQRYLDRSYTSNEEAYRAIRELVRSLKDPGTRFLDPVEFKNMLTDPSGEVVGIGLQVALEEESRQIKVVEPIEGSPAKKAGIVAGDIINTIDGKSVQGQDVNRVVSLLRGKAGTSVTLGLLRNNQLITLPVQRAYTEILAVKYGVRETGMSRVGYIRCFQFSVNAPKQMADAIKNLEQQNVSGYILDLRSNPGGLLNSVIDTTRLWLNQGIIMSTLSRNGKLTQERAMNRALTQKPIVILVDGGSVGGTEIIAAALQENQRASLVGTLTFGQSSFRAVRSISNGAGLSVTTSKWLTPTGKDVGERGVAPDVVIELTADQRRELIRDRSKIGTTADPQFVKAVEVLNQRL